MSSLELVDTVVTHANINGFGLTLLSGDRHGFMPPLLKTKQRRAFNSAFCFCMKQFWTNQLVCFWPIVGWNKSCQFGIKSPIWQYSCLLCMQERESFPSFSLSPLSFYLEQHSTPYCMHHYGPYSIKIVQKKIIIIPIYTSTFIYEFVLRIILRWLKVRK